MTHNYKTYALHVHTRYSSKNMQFVERKVKKRKMKPPYDRNSPPPKVSRHGYGRENLFGKKKKRIKQVVQMEP